MRKSEIDENKTFQHSVRQRVLKLEKKMDYYINVLGKSVHHCSTGITIFSLPLNGFWGKKSIFKKIIISIFLWGCHRQDIRKCYY